MMMTPNPCSDVVLALNRVFDWLELQEQALASAYGYDDSDFNIGDREGAYETRFQTVVFLTLYYYLAKEANEEGISLEEYTAKQSIYSLTIRLSEIYVLTSIKCIDFSGVSKEHLPPIEETVAYGLGHLCANHKGSTGQETDLDRLEEMIEKPFSYFYPTENDNCRPTS